MRQARALLLASMLLSCAGGALAQLVPLGSPFLVNTTRKGEQSSPSVAADKAGRFAILWMSVCVPEANQSPVPCTPDPLKHATFGRWFDAAGQPVGPEVQLSDFVEQFSHPPGLAVGADGSFFAVWVNQGVFGRLFDSLGRPKGPEVRISQVHKDQTPVVTALRGGGYAVAWVREEPVSGFRTVLARRLDTRGRPLQGLIRVSALNRHVSQDPAIAPDLAGPAGSPGGFLVAWSQFPPRGMPLLGTTLAARRFSASGEPLGEEIQLSSGEFPGEVAGFPAVAPRSGGGFLVTWIEIDVTGQLREVQARVVGPDGAPGEKRLIGFTHELGRSSLTRDPRGGFLAVWSRAEGGTPPAYAVVGRHLDENGRPAGSEVQIMADAEWRKLTTSVDAVRNGFVVAWSGGGAYRGGRPGPDRDDTGVFARRLGSTAAGIDLTLPLPGNPDGL